MRKGKKGEEPSPGSEYRADLPNRRGNSARTLPSKPMCGEYRNSPLDNPHHWMLTHQLRDAKGRLVDMYSALPFDLKAKGDDYQVDENFDLIELGYSKRGVLLGRYWAILPRETLVPSRVYELRDPRCLGNLRAHVKMLAEEWRPWGGFVEDALPGCSLDYEVMPGQPIPNLIGPASVVTSSK